MKDKVTLITGGAVGIGKASAKRFAAEGARVVICDINQEAGEVTVAKLGREASFYKVDVTDRVAVKEMVINVDKKYGRIDVLLNNAGILRDSLMIKVKNGGNIVEMPEFDFDLVVSVNLKGTFNCTQAVLRTMIRQGGGVILNASSIVGIDGNRGQTNYVATKAGIIGMTKVWARELGRYNIRVNAVAPGFTTTDILSKTPAKVLENMKDRIPLGRFGRPEDIANAYLFLACEEAAYITGAVVRVDGGLVIGT